MEAQSNSGIRKSTLVLVVTALSLATLMPAVDINIVNIGLPTLAKVFQTSFANLQWITLSYLLMVTSFIVAIGRVSDIFGKKWILLVGLVFFVIPSFICGLLRNVYLLIAMRALHGVGGGILMALAFALASDLVPKKKLPFVMAILTSMVPIGFAVGSSIGGLLIAHLGWQTVFFFNVPIGIVAFILVLFFPTIPISEKSRKLDVGGIVLLILLLASYILAMTLSESQGFSRTVLLLVVAGTAALIAFLLWERHTLTPVVELGIFRNPSFSSCLFINVLNYTVITGAVFILPFYLQYAKGYSTAMSGLLMTSGPLGCAIATYVAEPLEKRFGNHPVMIVGVVCLMIGSFFMATLNTFTSGLLFAVIMFLFNSALALFQTPGNVDIMSMAKPEQRGVVSGLLNLSRTVGQTAGAAVIGTLFYFFIHTKTIKSVPPESIVNGIHYSFLIAGGMLVVGSLVGIIFLRSTPRKAVADAAQQVKAE